MKKKRMLSTAIALLLVFYLLPVSAFAEEYDLAAGSIEVTADEGGQYVSQTNGVQNEQQTTPTVIKQTDSSTTTTGNTVSISAAEGSTANVALSGVNIDASGAAVSTSGAGDVIIELDGNNTLYGGYKHAGLEMNGTGTLTITAENDEGKLTAEGGGRAAGIGSGDGNEMSGTICIGGNSQVRVSSGDIGAGIGSGSEGTMSGQIIIGDNAQVTAYSYGGAGIGSGVLGGMSGQVIIGDNAQVTAYSEYDSAGIGSGERGEMSGQVTIGGSSQVTAYSGRDGAGIGSGDNGAMSGQIIINGNAQVTAYSKDDGAGIGSGDDSVMSGKVIINGNAQVIAYGTFGGASIGSGDDGDLEDGFAVIVADTAIINGVPGSNYDGLLEIDELSEENLTVLKITDNGKGGFLAEVLHGEGEVDKILYGGSETAPTAPGSYPVTVVLKFGKETVEVEVGTLVIAKPGTGSYKSEPLYRVTDKDGRDIAHKAERKDGVLTITVEKDFAILTGKLSGIDTLKRQGIEKIVFVTNKATSTFKTADLLEKGKSGDTYNLTHDGKTVTFVVGEKKTGIKGILVKP